MAQYSTWRICVGRDVIGSELNAVFLREDIYRLYDNLFFSIISGLIAERT